MVFSYKNTNLSNFSRVYICSRIWWQLGRYQLEWLALLSLQWERCKDQKSDHFISWMMELMFERVGKGSQLTKFTNDGARITIHPS